MRINQASGGRCSHIARHGSLAASTEAAGRVHAWYPTNGRRPARRHDSSRPRETGASWRPPSPTAPAATRSTRARRRADAHVRARGFSPAVVALAEERDADAHVVQRLTLAPRSETVVVVGKAPVDSAPLRGPSMPPPPPLPVITPVPEHDRDSICGPAKPEAAPESFGTIRSLRYGARNELYAQDDQLIIDGGTSWPEVGATSLSPTIGVVIREQAELPGGFRLSPPTASSSAWWSMPATS